MLKLIDHFSGYWVVLESSHQGEKKDTENLEITLKLEPKAKLEVSFHIQHRNLR